MAALPPPVDVFIPPAPAAPEAPLFVDAADAIVTSLPWLPWGPAANVGGVQLNLECTSGGATLVEAG